MALLSSDVALSGMGAQREGAGNYFRERHEDVPKRVTEGAIPLSPLDIFKSFL